MSDMGHGANERFRDDAERKSRLIAEIRDLRMSILELMEDASISEAAKASVIASIENIERQLHPVEDDSTGADETPRSE